MNGPNGGRRGRPPRTIRVRMLTSECGADGRNLLEAGEEYEMPFARAQEYLTKPEDAPRAEVVAEKSVDRAEQRG